MEHFFCKTKIISGPGSLKTLADLHIKRLLMVTDPFFLENGVANHIAHISKAEHVEVFHKVVPDPTATLAAQGTQVATTFQPVTILALGGGSAMDCAKAMAYFSGLDLQLIAVPTTSGSGSEVTDFAILTHDGVKHPLVDDRLRPDIAILDSDLLATLPQKLIADTGFDLISHALEAWVATGAGTVSNALALSALQTAFSLLPKSFAGDTSVRGAVHTAATMAGMAFSSAGLGLCHALAHTLGGEFHIPHGRLNAILLPHVVAFNADKVQSRYAALARQLGLSTGPDVMALRALKNALIRLRRELTLPEDLTQAGIDPRRVRDRMESLAKAALADPCCASNPAQPTAADIRHILQAVMGHG